jgi:hypothetical protein
MELRELATRPYAEWIQLRRGLPTQSGFPMFADQGPLSWDRVQVDKDLRGLRGSVRKWADRWDLGEPWCLDAALAVLWRWACDESEALFAYTQWDQQPPGWTGSPLRVPQERSRKKRRPQARYFWIVAYVVGGFGTGTIEKFSHVSRTSLLEQIRLIANRLVLSLPTRRRGKRQWPTGEQQRLLAP